MYRSIYVPVDNSNYSQQAGERAMLLGAAFGAKVTGCHVYAAQMHDYRFKQMEYTLPSEYRQEEELERQRKIHDSLITMGLKLISDCYLDEMDKQCAAKQVQFARRMMDGKHYVEILKDINDPGLDYDLTVLGVMGIGKMKDSQLGAVCSRVAQGSAKDTWVVKHLPKAGDPERDTILVGIDGSPQSFGALVVAATLAQKFDKKLELIGVYDPYLHYMVFNSIVDVLNDKAAKVFRFEEQNQLHEEIIDTGLAQIYQSHLEVADSIAREQGVEIHKKTLLDGKVFQKIFDYTKKTNPWLLVLGRVGVHAAKEERGLGSNTENLLRLAPCDILLTTRLEYPELDRKAQESIKWTKEAEERMTRVPEMVRGIARTGILRLAVEEGHSVITNQVIDKAMDRFMPKNVALKTEKLGEMLAFEQAKTGNVSICKKCGVSAHDESPVKCAVCGGDQFEAITPEMVEKIISQEGGSDALSTYDGRTLAWTKEARRLLTLIEDKYQKRRAKALIEKSARVRKLNTVSKEFALVVLENELEIPITHEASQAIGKEIEAGRTQPMQEAKMAEAAISDDGKKSISRDDKNVPLISVFEWNTESVARIFRVPAGFMRDRVQKNVENLALDAKVLTIDLTLVEEAILHGRKEMEEMIAGYSKSSVSTLNEVGILQALERERSEG